MAQRPQRHTRSVFVPGEGVHVIVSDETGQRLRHDVHPDYDAGMRAALDASEQAIAEFGEENGSDDHFHDLAPDHVLLDDDNPLGTWVEDTTQPHPDVRQKAVLGGDDYPGLEEHELTQTGLSRGQAREAYLRGMDRARENFDRDAPEDFVYSESHTSLGPQHNAPHHGLRAAEARGYNAHRARLYGKAMSAFDASRGGALIGPTPLKRNKPALKSHEVREGDQVTDRFDDRELVVGAAQPSGRIQMNDRASGIPWIYMPLAMAEQTLEDDKTRTTYHERANNLLSATAKRPPSESEPGYEPLTPDKRLKCLRQKWLGKAASRRPAHRASYTEDERAIMSNYGVPVGHPSIQAQNQGEDWFYEMRDDPAQAGVPDLPEDPADEAHVAEHHSGSIVVSDGPVAPPRSLPSRTRKPAEEKALPSRTKASHNFVYQQRLTADEEALREAGTLHQQPFTEVPEERAAQAAETDAAVAARGTPAYQAIEHGHDYEAASYDDPDWAWEIVEDEKSLWRKLLPAEAGRFEKGHLPADFAKELAMGLLACKEFSGGVYVKARVRAPGGGISAKFTGTVKDSRGRTICFRNGKRCPCPKKQKAQGKGRPEAEYEEEELRGEGRPAPGQDRALPAMGPVAQLPPGQMVEASAIECEWYAVAGSLKVYDVCALSSFRSLNAALRDGVALDATQAMTHARLQRLFATANGQQNQPQPEVAEEAPAEPGMPQEQKGYRPDAFNSPEDAYDANDPKSPSGDLHVRMRAGRDSNVRLGDSDHPLAAAFAGMEPGPIVRDLMQQAADESSYGPTDPEESV